MKSKKGANPPKLQKELLAVVEDKTINISLIEGVAGDRMMTQEEKAILTRIRRRRGISFYSDLLFAITHEYIPPEAAKPLWKSILVHKKQMDDKLGRNVGIVVSTLDYVTNIRDTFEDSVLIRPQRKLTAVAEVALLDGLTGLLDHSTIMRKLAQELTRANRYGEVFSLLMLDLDDFKKFNDKHGHQKGDDVLERMGDILRDAARETDSVGRYGGEEFCAILPRTIPSEAVALAERIRESTQRSLAPALDATCSIGVASFPRDGETQKNLVKAADKALYKAKHDGKNRVVVFATGRRR